MDARFQPPVTFTHVWRSWRYPFIFATQGVFFFFLTFLLFCVCSCHYVFFLSCEQACADKLKREISEYGLPPQFPAVEEEEENTSETPVPSTAPVDKSKGKKVKQKDSY